jgi:hypothetical protein
MSKIADTLADDEPNPVQDARKQCLGLDLHEQLEIIDWNGPDDPENPLSQPLHLIPHTGY